jgi:aconitase A
VCGSAPIITKAHITRVNVDHLSLISNPGVVTQVPIEITVVRRDGKRDNIIGIAAVETRFEADLLREGGILPHILRSVMH